MARHACVAPFALTVVLLSLAGLHGLHSEHRPKECTPFEDIQAWQCFGNLEASLSRSEVIPTDSARFPEGSVCSRKTSELRVECRDGDWTQSDPSVKKFKEHAEGHQIQKRFTYGYYVRQNCRRKCKRIVFWKKCKTRCNSYTVANTRPSISCPSIPSRIYIDVDKDAKEVSWSVAQSNDKEQGSIGTSQTRGPSSGSRLLPGAYTVTYTARDEKGASNSCSVSFSVILRVCPSKPATPNYGFVVCSKGNRQGSRCRFSCSTGYRLVGSSTTECMASQRWNRATPRCQLLYCPTPSAVSKGTWAKCGKHSYGSVCTLNCSSGYKVVGGANIKCAASSKWTTPGRCLDVTPPSITCPDDIETQSGPLMAATRVTWDTPITSDNSGGPVSLSATRSSGSRFSPGLLEVRYTAHDGEMNQASCAFSVNVTVRRCEALPVPSNAIPASCSQGNVHGSVCSMGCVPGFRLEGSAKLRCQGDGEWDHRTPACPRVMCGAPPLAGGRGKFSCPDGHQFESSCHLTCEPGYQPVGNEFVTCQADKTWTTPGRCRDTTPPEFPDGCPDVQELSAPMGLETRVSFSLPKVTDNSGDTVKVTATHVSGSAFPAGSTNVVVLAKDQEGNNGSCTFMVEVKEQFCLSLQESGTFASDPKMTFTCPDGVLYGAACSLSCSDGNNVQGAQSVRCSQTSDQVLAWVWDGNSKPYCQDNVCPKMHAPTHGALVCEDNDVFEMCTVLCNDQYAYPNIQKTTDFVFCLKRMAKWLPFAVDKDSCQAGRMPDAVQMMSDVHYYSGPCHGQVDVIKEKFVQLLQTSGMLSPCEIFSCRVDSVSVACEKRSKRHATDDAGGDKHSKAKVSFRVSMAYRSQGDAKATSTFYDKLLLGMGLLVEARSGNGSLDIRHTGYVARPYLSSSKVNFNCQPLTVFSKQTGVCVPCGPGFWYNGVTKSCSACSVGYYQPEVKSSSCLPCPAGHSTLASGSTSFKSCLAKSEK